jgi:hypothetical protein
MKDLDIRAIVTEALGYWERKRIVYNAALTLVSLIGYFTSDFGSHVPLGFGTFVALFVWVVMANVLYCAAYLPELMIQASHYRERRHVVRIVIFTIGTLFACVLAFGMSHHPGAPD